MKGKGWYVCRDAELGSRGPETRDWASGGRGFSFLPTRKWPPWFAQWMNPPRRLAPFLQKSPDRTRDKALWKEATEFSAAIACVLWETSPCVFCTFGIRAQFFDIKQAKFIWLSALKPFLLITYVFSAKWAFPAHLVLHVVPKFQLSTLLVNVLER